MNSLLKFRETMEGKKLNKNRKTYKNLVMVLIFNCKGFFSFFFSKNYYFTQMSYK